MDNRRNCLFKKNLKKHTIEDISTHMKKSKYQIYLKVAQLNLIKPREWSQDEIKFLKENLHESSLDLASKLNRTLFSIKSKKKFLNKK